MGSFRESDLVETTFDAIPAPVLLVDDDVQIQEFNAAAAELLSPDNAVILRRRGGEVLHCIHAEKKGCGRSEHCPDCVLRQSVQDAVQGKKVVRRLAELELIKGKETQNIHLWISSTPVALKDQVSVLLVLDDVTELMTLRKLLPICAVCKRIRTDQDYWMALESYFQVHGNVDFSHSYCPDCIKAELAKLDRELHSQK